MAEIDVLKAQIIRQGSEAWGFRLEGGADRGTPCKINMISQGSPAARIGIKSSDVISEVGDVPTDGMTLEQVWNIIDQASDSLIITVERRARGNVPTNPVLSSDEPERKMYQTYNMSGGSQPRPRTQNYIPVGNVVTNPDGGITVIAPPPPRPDPVPERKSYQTYDINGPRQYVPPGPQQNYQFHTAQSRAFEDRPKPYYSPPAPASPVTYPPPQSPPSSPQQPPQQAYTSSVNFQQQPVTQSPTQDWEPQHRVPEGEQLEDGIPQSRTFRVLQSLMQNDDPEPVILARDPHSRRTVFQPVPDRPPALPTDTSASPSNLDTLLHHFPAGSPFAPSSRTQATVVTAPFSTYSLPAALHPKVKVDTDTSNNVTTNGVKPEMDSDRISRSSASSEAGSDVAFANRSFEIDGHPHSSTRRPSALSRRRPSVESSEELAPRPWSYRRYSQQVFTYKPSAGVEDEDHVFESDQLNNIRKKESELNDDQDVQSDIAQFVKDKMDEKRASGDVGDLEMEETEAEEHGLGLTSHDSNNTNKRDEFSLPEIVSQPIEPPTYDIDELDVESVNPDLYLDVLESLKPKANNNIKQYISTVDLPGLDNLEDMANNCVKNLVHLSVISAEDVIAFHNHRNNLTDGTTVFQNGYDSAMISEDTSYYKRQFEENNNFDEMLI